MTSMTSTDVGVLDKVMAILNAYDERTETLDPPTAARITGMTTPTAYRLMKAMAAHGLVTPTGHGYSLGPALLHLGGLVTVGQEALRAARPHMVDLRNQINETVELQVLVSSDRVPVHLEESTRPVRSAAQVGVHLPLHKGSSSRSLLAWRPDAVDLVRRSAEEAGDPFDEERFTQQLREVRARGYAVGLGEREAELAAASAPVLDDSGEVVAALTVSGTLTRFEEAEHLETAITGVLAAARATTGDLGGTFPI
ncbi:transcriptional regulator, IclR family [Kytococcus aerolatus]|uniref:Transcriptional regulator, IclR family n=1 Tax=Kytococcus aerolatus TaxID=592308 RepID=A0A212U278_9MICO|nr:IclR family transcriptional regulator [Kytococcus aerolatus]SNC72365.1 transcriptional regulator, IclR family [Kytococcus aerolatus]